MQNTAKNKMPPEKSHTRQPAGIPSRQWAGPPAGLGLCSQDGGQLIEVDGAQAGHGVPPSQRVKPCQRFDEPNMSKQTQTQNRTDSWESESKRIS